MTKIVVPISDEERILLVQMANKNLRHPRDEARMILRSVLLGDQPQPDKQKALPQISTVQAESD